MTYRVTNVPHEVRIEDSWQNKKVVHSLPSNVSKLIGHVVYILLDNSHKTCLSLNCMYSWPSDSKVPMHSINPTGKSCSLVLIVCQSRDAMIYVPSIPTNLAATKSDELLLSLK